MKLMLCETCHDLVVPDVVSDQPRVCRCGSGECWLMNHEMHVFHSDGLEAVSIVVIHNDILIEGFPPYDSVDGEDAGHAGCISKETIKNVISRSNGSLFDLLDSAVIRFRPGYTNDTFFSCKPHRHLNVSQTVDGSLQPVIKT